MIDDCDIAQLIRQGAHDRISGAAQPTHFSSEAEQTAYLDGWIAGKTYEQLLCPCLNMTRHACAGECGNVQGQRSFFEFH